MHSMSSLISKLSHTAAAQWLKTRLQTPGKRGQSFLELALVLPVLLIMLAGMTEIAFFIGRYLDMLDLTREAARFASVRDFKSVQAASAFDCSNSSVFDFYYDTACIFSPPAASVACVNAIYCNGFNPYILMNMATDDIVITVFTLGGDPTAGTYAVSNVHPGDKLIIGALGEDNTFLVPPAPANYILGKPGYWALSAQAGYWGVDHVDNWKKDCQGNPTGATTPYYTAARVNSILQDELSKGMTAITRNKGFVAVEFYYCYRQVLGLPIVSQIMPNPARIHAYTLMPLPAAQPTPTPLP